MRSSSRPLFVLHPDAGFRSRVMQAGSASFACWSVAEWEPFRDAVRDAPPTLVVVVDPYARGREGGISPHLHGLLRDYPWASVVAAVDLSVGPSGEVHALAELGISEVIVLGVEDTIPGIRRVLRQAQGRFVKELLGRVVPPYLTGRGRAVVLAAAEAISSGGHAPDLARALAVSTKTLARWCGGAYLPPPRRLLAWIRVLLASALLDDPARTVSGVARACGYTSDTALRRALLDFLGLGPTQLRETGAFDAAARALLAELHELRERGRAKRRRRVLAARRMAEEEGETAPWTE